MIKKTLYFGNPAYLSLRQNQLVIQLPEAEENLADCLKAEAVRTVPIEDIGVVVLDHRQISLTSALMAALLDNNCALISCDSRGLPVGLTLPLSGHTIQNERFRKQLEASVPLRKQLWQQTIQAKISNQATVLQRYTRQEVKCMRVWAAGVKSGDPENVEARAAAYYWKTLFGPGFTRNREGPPPNALLNYGYAILRAVVARALVSSGLLATWGIHHHNRYNAYCLADDIMEPYRPYVDELVWTLVEAHGLDGCATLSRELKAELLRIPVLTVVMGGRRSPLMVAASLTASSLSKCFNGESRKIVYPEL